MSNEFADTPAHVRAPSDLNGSNRDATPMARSTRELAILVERQARQVEELLRVVHMQRELTATTAAFPRLSAEPTPRDRIMSALATAKDGKPGRMTTTALIAATGLGKSSVWHHCLELNDRGAVVIIKGKRLPNGKRGPDVVVHADDCVV